MWNKTYLSESNEKVTYLEKDLDNEQRKLEDICSKIELLKKILEIE